MHTVDLLRERIDEIRARFGVARVAVFGSFARGEGRTDSDVDVLVEFAPGQKTFDNYVGLQDYLEGLLGRSVDLVIRDAVKPRLRDRILGEAVYA